jgi:type IX secretion system PorP/SprF family membrane protein
LGIKAFHDLIGYTELLNLAPSFAHLFRLNGDRMRVSMGLAYKVQRISFDFSSATTGLPDDPALYRNETRWNVHNADIGIELVNRSFIIGASGQNIVSLFTGEKDELQTNTNFLYVMNRIPFDNSFHLLSGITAIKNDQLFQMEFMTSVLLRTRNTPDFQIGAFYRTIREFGVLFGMDISDSMKLAFSYDYNISGISHNSYGSPEIMLLWKFGKIGNCGCSELFK